MILMLAVTASILVAVCADCDACVDRLCHSRHTLVQGFPVSDQMAIDRVHSMLYLQLNSNLNTAFYLSDLKIRLVQSLKTSGLAIDDKNNILYTADKNKNVYKYDHSSNTTLISTMKVHKEADLLYYKNTLYYTIKCCPGLYCFEGYESRSIIKLQNYSITDFVVDGEKNIYFVSQNRVYKFNNDWLHDPEVLNDKGYMLAIDKNDVVYFGDASLNVIYKLDKTTNKLHEYAAYKSGSVDQVVFDGSNRIVFHDSSDGTVNHWKPGSDSCTLEAPHDKYSITQGPVNPCNEQDQSFWHK